MDNLKTITILFRSKNYLELVIKEDIKTCGLNPTEFGTLEALYHKGELSVQQIIDKVLIANSSMSYVLDLLKKKNYIKRTQDKKDKRIFKISLTTQGKEFMDMIYPKHQQTLRNRLDVLTHEEESQLQTLLKKIGKQ